MWFIDLGIINGGFVRGDRLYRVKMKVTVGLARTELQKSYCVRRKFYPFIFVGCVVRKKSVCECLFFINVYGL